MSKEFSEGIEADKDATGILKQASEQDINQLIKGVYGTIIISGLLVKPNSPSDNTVLIETGSGMIYKHSTTTYHAIDLLSQDQQTIDPVSASGKERWDLISINTIDTVVVTKGSEADTGNAVLPVVPDDELCLAFVYINETTGNVDILAGDITDRRLIGAKYAEKYTDDHEAKVNNPHGVTNVQVLPSIHDDYVVIDVIRLGHGIHSTQLTSYQNYGAPSMTWAYSFSRYSNYDAAKLKFIYTGSHRTSNASAASSIELWNDTDSQQVIAMSNSTTETDSSRFYLTYANIVDGKRYRARHKIANASYISYLEDAYILVVAPVE